MSCFQLNYSKALLDHSSCKVFLGGRFDPKKANFFERTIFKLVAKQSTLVDTISSKDIATFAKIIVE